MALPVKATAATRIEIFLIVWQVHIANLHAAWKQSLLKMHRFVVRRSGISGQGVYSTGIACADATQSPTLSLPVCLQTKPELRLSEHAVLQRTSQLVSS